VQACRRRLPLHTDLLHPLDADFSETRHA
jgi:hypothetical protein